MMMKSALYSVLLATLGLTACVGYKHGSLMHPQVSSIAVGTIDNQTDEPRLALYARSRLPELFQRDGSLTVAAKGNADCIVHSTVTGYQLHTLGEVRTRSDEDRQEFNRTTVFGITVNVEYEVLLPGRERPLIARQAVTGKAEFTELVDFDQVKESGLKQAMYDATNQIVSNIVEAW